MGGEVERFTAATYGLANHCPRLFPALKIFICIPSPSLLPTKTPLLSPANKSELALESQEKPGDVQLKGSRKLR